jgi:glycosyltransferase involved in cell wall biosynthesis
VSRFSIIILTQDEENNLPECLRSISWCDDIVVLDSGSSDRTLSLAEAAGCQVLHRKFDDFGTQRNYALDHATFKYDWVFHLDADERFTEALRVECVNKIADDDKSGYFVPSKLLLGTCWLKYSGCYPTYQMRFHKVGEVRFIAHGHGQRESDALRGIGTLREPYIHYNFSKGLEEWFRKHVGYAKREAQLVSSKIEPRKLFSRDAVVRRRTLKQLTLNAPCRPFLKFSYLYFVRRGLLDGRAGFMYCVMQAVYEFMIVLFRWELKTSNAIAKKAINVDR